jgi:hypothetical protein
MLYFKLDDKCPKCGKTGWMCNDEIQDDNLMQCECGHYWESSVRQVQIEDIKKDE